MWEDNHPYPNYPQRWHDNYAPVVERYRPVKYLQVHPVHHSFANNQPYAARQVGFDADDWELYKEVIGL